MNVEEIFETHKDKYLEFDGVEVKRSQRADLHAFLLLDELFSGENGSDIIGGAEHDKIWLAITKEQTEALTEPQAIELIRCGVKYDYGSLCMFA